jgi:hypothetical protein
VSSQHVGLCFIAKKHLNGDGSKVPIQSNLRMDTGPSRRGRVGVTLAHVPAPLRAVARRLYWRIQPDGL